MQGQAQPQPQPNGWPSTIGRTLPLLQQSPPTAWPQPVRQQSMPQVQLPMPQMQQTPAPQMQQMQQMPQPQFGSSMQFVTGLQPPHPQQNAFPGMLGQNFQPVNAVPMQGLAIARR